MSALSLVPPVSCAECGFRAEAADASAIAAIGPEFQGELSGADEALLRKRPDQTSWSALEYAAHMRDVIALWGGALHRAITEDRPRLSRPDPDIADRIASEAGYNDQDPGAVLEQLAANASRMARKAEQVETDWWGRVILIGDEQLSARDIVVKVAHEGHHHLLDVQRVLR